MKNLFKKMMTPILERRFVLPPRPLRWYSQHARSRSGDRAQHCAWGTVAGGLENELTVDHSGNAVVKTLTLSLDAREPHGREADYTEQKIKV